MAVDLTPRLATGRTLIESYGKGGFRIAGQRYENSVLVLPTEVHAWPVAAIADITAQSLAPLLGQGGGRAPVEILLLGCGARFAMIPAALRAELRAMGLRCDGMDTGAACRTYNVLLAEDRRVAAALIAID